MNSRLRCGKFFLTLLLVNLIVLCIFLKMTKVSKVYETNEKDELVVPSADPERETKNGAVTDKYHQVDVMLKKATQHKQKNGHRFKLEERKELQLYNDFVLKACKSEDDKHLSDIFNMSVCDCQGRFHELQKQLDVDMENIQNLTWAEVNEQLSDLDLKLGGSWRPSSCVPRRRVAIIIPFRDRESHLMAFLVHTHPVLQKQQVEYQIFVVEQNSPRIFNKGSLMNAGFKEVLSMDFKPDCFVFHDVDLLVETERNIFMCGSLVIHFAAYIDKFDYELLYGSMLGGAVALTPEQFQQANGYSNKFSGWGGEDDDFYRRVKHEFDHIYRPPSSISRYKMIKHERDAQNPYNETIAKQGFRTLFHHKEGLNTVNYTIVSLQYLATHTRIMVDIL